MDRKKTLIIPKINNINKRLYEKKIYKLYRKKLYKEVKKDTHKKMTYTKKKLYEKRQGYIQRKR